MKKRAKSLSANTKGFSLVEVVLALGVAAFALLAIISLLPAGLKSARESIDESRAITLLGKVIADRQTSPSSNASIQYQLPPLGLTETNVIFVTENGEKVATPDQARYRVSYAALPVNSDRKDPYLVGVQIAWPAPATTPSGYVETLASFPQ